jgi:hypothetical protein
MNIGTVRLYKDINPKGRLLYSTLASSTMRA